MPGEQVKQGNYLTIVGGLVRKKVSQDTDGAVRRDYELKDGTGGTKYELIYKNWGGILKGLKIKDGKYGQVLEVIFEDAILSISVDSKYFNAFMQKIKSAKLDQELVVAPYDFEGDDGKKMTGITIYQNRKKLENGYYDPTEGKWCNGYPQISKHKDSMTKNDWKKFFITVQDFFIEEVKELDARIQKIQTQLEDELEEEKDELDQKKIDEELEKSFAEVDEEKEAMKDENEIKVKDIPF